ncbi:MAG: hypothetical protein PHH93_06875, partial [Prolixibacteraceae bacterium]|nr:hypothetical protein [Prolixibacteraceae bacterium]
MINLKKILFCLLMPVLIIIVLNPLSAQTPGESENLLLNPGFEFHSFINHREGIPVSYTSGNVAFWNTDVWGDITVMRESHADDHIRPDFSVHNLVAISPGKKIWQFFTLPEAGLAHGEKVNLYVHGYQPKEDMLKAKIKMMKPDSEDGEWSPADYGMKDSRTFPRHSRGELVVAKEYAATETGEGLIKIDIRNAGIPGKVSTGNVSSSDDINTIGIQVEFENMDNSDTVWIFSPAFTVSKPASQNLPQARSMEPDYRYIPRTIQKLWKGEPIHILVMGSSIDRGSANPPMYLYDEDPGSVTFKQPLAEGLFDGEKAGVPEVDSYYGQWRHYFSYAGRLKLELMRKFNLPPDKICLNFMACDGSNVGEAHSGLKEYCSLSLPPSPEANGHKSGKSWEELYPELFTRKGGPGPDLVIFGSGANEKTDTPDEIAVFEGMIRWIQQHYPYSEFLFCQFQNFGGYTPNPGDLQALSLRYQIPFMDFGKINDDIVRWSNRYALVPFDGHPQAAGHYLWFKQLEKAFECWDPIVPGQARLQLPERIHKNTYNWEGEMVSFDSSSKRIKGNMFIFEDGAVNCWGKADNEKPLPYVDGKLYESRRSSPKYDLRNSMFRFGRTSLGDRHILEISGDNPELTYVDAKICPGRQSYFVDNPVWELKGLSTDEFVSEWGAPYGSKKVVLEPGKSVEAEVVCTDISVAYADIPNGGILKIYVDDQLKVTQPANIPFTDTNKKSYFMENRKGIPDLGYGLHKVRLEAEHGPVPVLGLFTYDSRPNRNSERRIAG